MLKRIMQKIEINNNNKVIRKTFQRNLQTIDTVSAYINNKLYYREWNINEYMRKQKISQTYNADHVIKNSKHKIDFYV